MSRLGSSVCHGRHFLALAELVMVAFLLLPRGTGLPMPLASAQEASMVGPDPGNATLEEVARLVAQTGDLGARLDALNAAVNESATTDATLNASLAAYLQAASFAAAHDDRRITGLGENLSSAEARLAALDSRDSSFEEELGAVDAALSNLTLNMTGLPAIRAGLEENFTRVNSLLAGLDANTTTDHGKLYALAAVTDPNDPDYGKPLAWKILEGEATLGSNERNLSLQGQGSFEGLAGLLNLSSAFNAKRTDELNARLDHQDAKANWLLLLLLACILLSLIPNLVLFAPEIAQRIHHARHRTQPTQAEALELPTDEEVERAALEARRTPSAPASPLGEGRSRPLLMIDAHPEEL